MRLNFVFELVFVLYSLCGFILNLCCIIRVIFMYPFASSNILGLFCVTLHPISEYRDEHMSTYTQERYEL